MALVDLLSEIGFCGGVPSLSENERMVTVVRVSEGGAAIAVWGAACTQAWRMRNFIRTGGPGDGMLVQRECRGDV